MISSDIAVDFGTSTIRIFLEGKGLVMSEPAVMAVNNDTGEVIAIGRNAQNMLGKTGRSVSVKSPFVGGLVADYSIADHMVTAYIKKIGMGTIFLPSAVVCVPQDITEVERQAISDVVERSGIRKLSFVEDIVAATLGAGLNPKSSVGIMVADIGQAKTAAAVMAANQVVAEKRSNIAGQSFNEALIKYVRKKHALEIGPQTAEMAKREIGCAFPRLKLISCHIKGKDINTGLPKDVLLTSDETVEAFVDPSMQIAKIFEECLEFVPPEILGDIARGSITLTGGGSLLYGLDKFLSRRLKLPVTLIEEPENAVIMGMSQRM